MLNNGQPTGGYNKVPAQQQGFRTLMAILNEPDATAFLMPTFAVQNPAGKYVTPTAASMAAAVKDMTVNSDGITREDNPNAKDPAAYPLTMVSYAMVPTGGSPSRRPPRSPIGSTTSPAAVRTREPISASCPWATCRCPGSCASRR